MVSLNSRDRALIVFALLMLVGSLYFFTRLGLDSARKTSGPVIAQISAARADVRAKSAGEMMWFAAEPRQTLAAGDSVFSGADSSAVVKMRAGGSIQLGPNSMIVLREDRGINFASLESGTFALSLNGRLPVMVGGQLTYVEGLGEVTLAVEKNNPVPRIVKGSAKIDPGGQARESARRELPGTRVSLQVPNLFEMPSAIRHDWRVRDWFEARTDESLSRRSAAPTVVGEEVALRWTDGGAGPVRIEVNGEASGVKTVFEAAQNPFVLREVSLGLNQARASRDGTLWSEARTFRVEGQFALSAPRWAETSGRVHLPRAGGPAVHALRWSPVPEAVGYLVESAGRADFEVSRIERAVDPRFEISSARPGQIFARVWAFDEKGRLSSASDPRTLITLTPRPLPPAPTELPRAPAAVEITPRAEAPPPPPKSAPAAAPETSLRAKIVAAGERLNQWFTKSKLQIEGAALNMYSSEQSRAGAPAPQVGVFGLRWTRWFGDLGAEIAGRIQALAVNQAGGQTKTVSGEARFYRRTKMVWPEFWIFKNYQAAFVLGLEVYRNDNPGHFVDHYEMLKSGVALSVPFANRWETGGEALLGLTSDFTRKYELSGFVNYFWAKPWALGLGYRVHLYEAQTSASSPGAMPYREAYGEGFGLLKYHF